jgi:GT2 family glycosyltransferase
MASTPLLTLILAGPEDPEATAVALHSLRNFAHAVQLIPLYPLPDAAEDLLITPLPGNPPAGLASLINRALSVARGEFLALFPPGAQASPRLLTFLQESNRRHPESNYFYGDYYVRSRTGSQERIEANCCPDDITEREDWGPLEIYRVQALQEIGGCDEDLRFRADYDLRLKLTDAQPAVHIPEALCTIPKTVGEQAGNASMLFFPGRGKFGGFSYLFMDPAEETEIEKIFYRMLQRRNAFLIEPPGGSFPPPSFTSPRVSVVIPVHNRAEFLPKSVGSVLQGSFEDFEILIVDNASEDETLQVARRLAAADSRIRVIPLEDNIIAKALNVGVAAARGEYIAQLDSDDEYTPDTLAVMVDHLDHHPEEALAISYYELMDPDGITLHEFGVIKHLEYNRNNMLRVDGAGALRCWRRAAILELGGFNESDFGHYGEDYDLVLKAAERYEVGRVHRVLYRYRRHPGNSDILRPHAMKIRNKTLARIRALQRRREINQQRLR